MPLLNMAQPFHGGSEFNLISPMDYDHEVVNSRRINHDRSKFILIFKILQLALILISLTLYICGNDLVETQIRLAATYIVHGAFLAIPIVVLINPKFCSSAHMMGFNLVGAMSLLTIGAMALATWWQIQQHMEMSGLKLTANSLALIAVSSQLKAISGMLCILNGVLYLIESILILLWDFSAENS